MRNSITRWLADLLDRWAVRHMDRRLPDVVIGGSEAPYLMRWWVIPRNPILNVYLHEFRRDDDDRAEHCHPWLSLSLALGGGRMIEIIRHGEQVYRLREIGPGSLVFRRGVHAHRMTIDGIGKPRTLFITGPRFREWGFWCANSRWVHWKEFTAPTDSSRIGKGCGEA